MFFFFFFNDTATTEIYTLSLHDALPILLDQTAHFPVSDNGKVLKHGALPPGSGASESFARDRKSTRLNSSHSQISYAVFCLKKKNNYKYYSIVLHPSSLKTILAT